MDPRRHVGTIAVAAAATTAVCAPSASAATPSTGSIFSAASEVQGTASISGRLLDASNSPLSGVTVHAVDPQKGYVGEAFSADGGTFTIENLAASSTGLYVCTDDLNYEDDPVPGGRPSECFPHFYWNPTEGASGVPAGAAAVTLDDGQHADVGTMRIAQASTIAGHVHTQSGDRLAGFDVVVRSISHPDLTFDYFKVWNEAAARHDPFQYAFPQLPPSARGWQVCFRNNDGASVYKQPPNRHGYLNSCYRTTPWPGKRLPATSTPVKVEPGKTVTRIDGVAKTGSRLTGALVNRRGNGVSALVQVFGGGGRYLGRAPTSHGRYSVIGLSRVNKVKVCASDLNKKYVDTCATKKVTTRPGHTEAGPTVVVRDAG